MIVSKKNKNKKFIIICSNNQIINRIQYYLNYYYKNTINLYILKDKQDILKNIKSINPHIILLDGEFNSISSFELVIRIKKLKLKNYIILFSSSQDLKSSFLKMGIASFIPKPFDYKLIINNCEKILNYSFKTLKNIIDPVKCFFFFEYLPLLKNLIESLKVKLEEIDITNVDISILNENNEYVFWKKNNPIWHHTFTKLFFNDLILSNHYNNNYINMKSSKDNFYLNFKDTKHKDIRQETTKEENGYYFFLYDDKFKCKIEYTIITKFKENADIKWCKDLIRILNIYNHRLIAIFSFLILKDKLSFKEENIKNKLYDNPVDFLIKFMN
ncbi:hypothetical protein AB836_01975 [Rickettsiales bacterium (ex Bugula neritina AB1)]|nr:hypothetical protein AB836_01975 [Rickettsiales bacterium (ex Bugula neritina AB1)]